MTAHSLIEKAADRDQQSLIARCKEKRWALLQSFAELEIALGERQDKVMKTFGAKLRARIKLDPAFKKFEQLIATRNLVAHAHVSVACIAGRWQTIWHMADGECNAAIMPEAALERWHKDTMTLLKDALAGMKP